MDRLDTIELFTAVVETGSFSEAGRRLGHAPSAVSRRIDDLEGWIGGTLFYRTTRKLTLTEVGRAFHGRARQILLDLEEARVTSAGLEDYPTGMLRITVAASFGWHMTAALHEFQQRWPGISFLTSFTDRVADMVAEGIDVAVRTGSLRDSSLKARRIGRARRIVCASPGYLKHHGTPETPEALGEHNCLTFRSSPGHNTWRFRTGRRSVDIAARGKFHSDAGTQLVTAARIGAGIVLVPEWLVGADLKAGRLVPVLEGYPPVPDFTSVYAVHAYSRFVPPKVRVFVDFLADRFLKGYDWSETG